MRPDELAGVLADGFGLGTPTGLHRVARGAMGAVWRLAVTGPASYAAKELFWFDPSQDAVAAEVAYVERCRTAGVRSQRAVATPSGRYVLPADGRWWRLYEWIDGGVPDRTDPAIASWMTRQMARIHAVDAPGGYDAGPPAADRLWYYRVDADWPGLAVDARRAGVSWAGQLDAAVRRLCELTALVNAGPVGAMVRCHRDLNGDNVVLDPAGARWLVDWDNYGPLEPWRELGALLVEHAAEPVALSGLAATYRDAGGPIARSNDFVAPAGGTLFATGLAIWLNFLAEQARTVLDGGVDAEQGAWSAARVAGLIGPFPSVPELDAAAGVVHAALSGSGAVDG
jgi:hypothetical protein